MAATAGDTAQHISYNNKKIKPRIGGDDSAQGILHAKVREIFERNSNAAFSSTLVANKQLDGAIIFNTLAAELTNANPSDIQEPEFVKIKDSPTFKEDFIEIIRTNNNILKLLDDTYPRPDFTLSFDYDDCHTRVFTNDRSIIRAIDSLIKQRYRKKHSLLFKTNIQNTNDYTIEIFCNNAFRVANDITNALYEFSRKTITLRTIVEHEEFWIDCFTRPSVHIYSILPHDARNRNSADIVTVSQNIDDGINYIPDELRIIDLLQQKMIMDNTDEYHLLFESTINIYEQHLVEVNKKAAREVFGGKTQTKRKSSKLSKSSRVTLRAGGYMAYDSANDDDSPIDILQKYGGDAFTGKTCVEKKKDIVFQIKAMIMDTIVKNNARIVTFGTWAEYVRNELDCVVNDRIQLASPDGFAEIMDQVSYFIRQNFPTYSVKSSSSQYMKIPKEYMLTSRLIKLRVPGQSDKEYMLIEYFNILEYQCVPVYKQQTADWFIHLDRFGMMYFTFIELLILFQIYSSESISTNKYIQLVSNLITMAKKSNAYPMANSLIGIYMPDEEKKVKMYSTDSHRTANYIPYLWLSSHKELRSI